MAFRKEYVSPRGVTVVAKTPVEVNDLVARGYKLKPAPPVKDESRRRAPKSAPKPESRFSGFKPAPKTDDESEK